MICPECYRSIGCGGAYCILNFDAWWSKIMRYTNSCGECHGGVYYDFI